MATVTLSAKLTHMDNSWRKRLLSLRQELVDLEAAARDGRGAVELDQSRVGRLSRMDALQGQAMNQAIGARRQQMLARLDAALTRLESGEFGYCQECGDAIVEKRLEIDPTTLFCTSCQSGRA